MDDMLVFAGNKAQLRAMLAMIEAFIEQHLQLGLKPSATRIAPVTEGVPFLGFRIFPGLIRLDPRSLRRFRRRLRSRERACQAGEIDVETLTTSVQNMIAHMRHADTHRLRQSLLSPSCVQG